MAVEVELDVEPDVELDELGVESPEELDAAGDDVDDERLSVR